MTGLKPCPFCGGKAEIKQMHNGNPYICCSGDCSVVLDGETEQEAIEAWNTRAERTCAVVDGKCSNCGDKIDLTVAAYCRCCGAKVVSENE